MNKEYSQKNPLETLPDAELVEEAKKLVEEIERIGYSAPSLALLITGSRYRLDSIRYEAIRTQEEELSRPLTDSEKDRIWKEMARAYVPLSPDNLIEVYRHQYDIEQKEKRLGGPKYPKQNTDQYQKIREIFERISRLLQEFKRRYPDKPPSEYLPVKLGNEWID